MNDLAVRASGLPAIPPILAASITYLKVCDAEGQPRPRRYPAEAVEAAKAALVDAERALEPAPVKAVVAWLRPLLAAGLPRAPDAECLPAYATVLALACEGLPAGVWTRAALSQVVASCRYWPTPAEVRAVLDPIALEIQHPVWQLRHIARAEAAEPAQPLEPLTDAQRAEIAAGLRRLSASIRATDGPDDQRREPSDVSLRGDALAAFRAAARERIGA